MLTERSELRPVWRKVAINDLTEVSDHFTLAGLQKSARQHQRKTLGDVVAAALNSCRR